jgi:hypothetical protein
VRALAANDRDLRLVDLLETQHVAAHPLPPLCVLERMSQRLTGPPSSNLLRAWTPLSSRRKPHSDSSAISTSAIRLLVVGSHPGNSMPAALRI